MRPILTAQFFACLWSAVVYGFLATLRLFSPFDPRGADRAQVCGYPGIAAAHCKLDRGQYRPLSPGWANVDAGQRTDAAETANSDAGRRSSRSRRNGQSGFFAARETEIEPARSPQVAAVAPAENARAEEPLDPKPAAGTPTPAGPPLHDSGCAADGPRRQPASGCGRPIRRPAMTRCGGFRPWNRVFTWSRFAARTSGRRIRRIHRLVHVATSTP